MNRRKTPFEKKKTNVKIQERRYIKLICSFSDIVFFNQKDVRSEKLACKKNLPFITIFSNFNALNEWKTRIKKYFYPDPS